MGGAILVKILKDGESNLEKEIKKLSLKLFLNFVSFVGTKS
jgi:hypothetical protein